MLVMTIGLAGMAYMYISGIFTAQTQGIEIVDSYCVDNKVYVTLRNIGTLNVNTTQIACTKTTPSPSTSCSLNPSTTISPGNQTQVDLSATCSGNCVYRLVPPAGRAIQVVVSCT
jgi:hypothetical protein